MKRRSPLVFFKKPKVNMKEVPCEIVQNFLIELNRVRTFIQSIIFSPEWSKSETWEFEMAVTEGLLKLFNLENKLEDGKVSKHFLEELFDIEHQFIYKSYVIFNPSLVY